MGVFDFLKKQTPGQAPIVPVSSKDERLGKLDLPPLAPPPPPNRSVLPITVGSLPQLPKLPSLPQTSEVKLPRLDELPKISVASSTPSTVPHGAPPLPTLPPFHPTSSESPAEKIMENFDDAADKPMRRLEMPVEKPVETPVQQPAEKPLPKQAEPEASAKIQKMLEELTTADFELPPLQALSEAKVDSSMVRLKRQGPVFIPVAKYEETLVHAAATAEGFSGIEMHNEKLGTIENQTKEAIDGLMAAFDMIQKTLLTVDERLFKVN